MNWNKIVTVLKESPVLKVFGWSGVLGLLAWPMMGGQNALILVALLLLLQGIALSLPRHHPFPVLTLVSSFLGRRLKVVYAVTGLTALLLPPFLNSYYVDILSLAWLHALLSMGLNVTVGYTGLLDLGYAGFYGVGAYTYALLSTRLAVPFWPGLIAGGAVAASFGVILGMITLRLRGDYLAIVTLGFVQIVYLILNNWDGLTHGPNGILGVKGPQIAGFVIHAPIHFYYLILALAVGVAGCLHRLMRSQIGRAFLAIREDAAAAGAMGIDTTRMKILAFSLGAGVAGIGGVFFAARYAFVSPESFSFLESVRILSMVVLGGMGSLPGAISGAFLLTLLPEMLRDFSSYRMLIFGMALVVMMRFRPQGLFGKGR